MCIRDRVKDVLALDTVADHKAAGDLGKGRMQVVPPHELDAQGIFTQAVVEMCIRDRRKGVRQLTQSGRGAGEDVLRVLYGDHFRVEPGETGLAHGVKREIFAKTGKNSVFPC